MSHAGWFLSFRPAVNSPGVMANHFFSSLVIWAWSENRQLEAVSCKEAPDKMRRAALRARASRRQKSGVWPVVFIVWRCNVRRLTPRSWAAVVGDVATARHCSMSETPDDIEAASRAIWTRLLMESGRPPSPSMCASIAAPGLSRTPINVSPSSMKISFDAAIRGETKKRWGLPGLCLMIRSRQPSGIIERACVVSAENDHVSRIGSSGAMSPP